MSNDKPQIMTTIKFRGVTIENITVEELRQLRDALNELVGDWGYVPAPYPQPYPVYPPYSPVWITSSGTGTVASDRITLTATDLFDVFTTR